jgi:hypothetical protein
MELLQTELKNVSGKSKINLTTYVVSKDLSSHSSRRASGLDQSKDSLEWSITKPQ